MSENHRFSKELHIQQRQHTIKNYTWDKSSQVCVRSLNHVHNNTVSRVLGTGQITLATFPFRLEHGGVYILLGGRNWQITGNGHCFADSTRVMPFKQFNGMVQYLYFAINFSVIPTFAAFFRQNYNALTSLHSNSVSHDLKEIIVHRNLYTIWLFFDHLVTFKPWKVLCCCGMYVS